MEEDETTIDYRDSNTMKTLTSKDGTCQLLTYPVLKSVLDVRSVGLS